MGYTIKYIKLFENNTPFKKISKQSNSNLESITRITNDIMISDIKEKFAEIYSNNFYSQYKVSCDDYYRSKKYYSTLARKSNMYDNLIRVYKGAEDGVIKCYDNIDIKITSTNVEVLIPCMIQPVNVRRAFIAMFESNNSLTPYTLFNGLFEYIFNDKKFGYVDILKSYGIDRLSYKVKFKILNLADAYMPDVIFYNYQTALCATDFMNGFINVFSNYQPKSSRINVYFINCFSNSHDLHEVNDVLEMFKEMCINTPIYVDMLYFDYLNEMQRCYMHLDYIMNDNTNFNFINMCSYMSSKSVPFKPNFVSLNDNLINNVNNLNLEILVNFEDATNNIERTRDMLSKRGFTNKLIDYIDNNIISNNQNEESSTEQFINVYDRSIMCNNIESENSMDNIIQVKLIKGFKESANNKFIYAIKICSTPIDDERLYKPDIKTKYKFI